jgi:hypothetical protein
MCLQPTFGLPVNEIFMEHSSISTSVNVFSEAEVRLSLEMSTEKDERRHEDGDG